MIRIAHLKDAFSRIFMPRVEGEEVGLQIDTGSTTSSIVTAA